MFKITSILKVLSCLAAIDGCGLVVAQHLLQHCHTLDTHNRLQREVAVVINKSQQGYSHIEDGRAELKIDDLIKLCRFYNVSADELLGLDINL